MPTIAVLGTFDTKGVEHAYIANAIRAQGCEVLTIDVGSSGPPTAPSDLSREVVAAAGASNWRDVCARQDRGECVALMATGAAQVVRRLHEEGRIHGIVSLGGGGGTAIATAAMRALPIGVPKVMVSTLAGGNVAAYVGASDIAMFPAIVDVAGVNRVSRIVFENAAGAICGMVAAAVKRGRDPAGEKPLVVASMFGNTTAGVTEAKRLLEAAGYEVLVYHATGVGGRAMEAVIASGLVTGVLDLTTTEWADELVGGILSAGPTRLEAAAHAGVPTVIAPGCLDMVNFGEPGSVPAKFAGRRFYAHNPQVTLMRTTPAECAALGRILAEKINRYRGPVTVLLPRGGISLISMPGQPFHDPAADEALFEALRRNLHASVPVVESDDAINHPRFAALCAQALLEQLKSPGAAASCSNRKPAAEKRV
jgi:uncharacterized protein (UPF0261 family)